MKGTHSHVFRKEESFVGFSYSNCLGYRGITNTAVQMAILLFLIIFANLQSIII
jgi:hypothetical protein